MSMAFSRSRAIFEAARFADQARQRDVHRPKTERFLSERAVGDRLETNLGTHGDGSAEVWTGLVVATAVDSEGDPMVIVEDRRGRRHTITLEFACQRDVILASPACTLTSGPAAGSAERDGRSL